MSETQTELDIQPDNELLAAMVGALDEPQEELPEVEEPQEPGPDDPLDGEGEPPVDDTPVEDRLKDFQEAYKEPETDPFDEYESKVSLAEQEFSQRDLLGDLPQLSHNGQSIYTLEEDQFDLYLQDLKDQGKETKAHEAAAARQKATERARQWYADKQVIQQARADLENHRPAKEWRQVEMEWVSKLPEVKDHIPAINQFIQQKAQDPIYAARLTTKDGKHRAVLQAVSELKVLQSAGDPEIQIPSAPDTKVVSKKVKSNTGKQTDKSKVFKSQKAFEALSDDEVRELLFEGE